ncbi:MAG TPA: type II secretion system major pseudopilin GspG [Myxococcota bacterium]|nr:type II secretion system major pseudopilin GspG [Myxococcota bacterium]
MVFALGQYRSSLAMTQIKDLEAALETFRMDNGRYPTTEEGLAALVAPPPTLEERSNYQANGYYLSGNRLPSDPWGNAYQYRNPGVHNASTFDLWSLGADGAPGGSGIDADLGNWPGGFAEHQALQQREHRLFLLQMAVAAAAILTVPIYLFGFVTAARGRRSWRSALVGRSFAALVCLISVSVLLFALFPLQID